MKNPIPSVKKYVRHLLLDWLSSVVCLGMLTWVLVSQHNALTHRQKNEAG